MHFESFVRRNYLKHSGNVNLKKYTGPESVPVHFVKGYAKMPKRPISVLININ